MIFSSLISDLPYMNKKDKILIALAVLVSAVAGAATYFSLPAVLLFILAAAAIILVAMIVGKATEQLAAWVRQQRGFYSLP